MKFVTAIFVLSSLSWCHSTVVNELGNVLKSVDSYKIGFATVFVQSEPNKHQVREIKFSKENIQLIEDEEIKEDINENDLISIRGVKHFDDASKPINVIKVTFNPSGHNTEEVKMVLKSECGHGINSTFEFYGNYFRYRV